MAKRRRFTLQSQGKTGVYVTESSTGLVAGIPIIPDARNPHLTVIPGAKTPMGRHLTYQEGATEKHIALGRLTRGARAEFGRFARKRLVKYLSGERAWRATDALAEEFAAIVGAPGPNGELLLPPAMLREFRDPALTDTTRWLPTTIRAVWEERLPLAMAGFRGSPCLVFPQSRDRAFMIRFEDLEDRMPAFIELIGYGSLVRFSLATQYGD